MRSGQRHPIVLVSLQRFILLPVNCLKGGFRWDFAKSGYRKTSNIERLSSVQILHVLHRYTVVIPCHSITAIEVERGFECFDSFIWSVLMRERPPQGVVDHSVEIVLTLCVLLGRLRGGERVRTLQPDSVHALQSPRLQQRNCSSQPGVRVLLHTRRADCSPHTSHTPSTTSNNALPP